MTYHLDLTHRAPARLAALKAYKYTKDWREAFEQKHVTGKAPAYNPPSAPYGENHARWIENTARAGLRFVGYVAESRHAQGEYFSPARSFGWYCDNYRGETYDPIVFQLPSRKGAERYVYGYMDPYNDGAAFLSFDPCYNKRAAQAWACKLAKRAAENSREWCAKEGAATRIAEIGDEISTLRADIIELCKECRKVCQHLGDAPKARDAIRRQIESMLEDRTKLFEERDTLRNDFWAIVPDGY